MIRFQPDENRAMVVNQSCFLMEFDFPINVSLLSAHSDCCFFAQCTNILTYLLV